MIKAGKWTFENKDAMDLEIDKAKSIYGKDITVGEFAEYMERKGNQQQINLKLNENQRG
jgi:hypothetical protein